MPASRPRWWLPALGGLALALLAQGGLAADGNDATARALAKAQALLKQVNAQKVAAETELAKARLELADKTGQVERLGTELKSSKAGLEAADARLAAADRSGKALGGELEKNRTALATTREKLAALATQHKETTATLRATEAARAELAASLSATQAELKDSEQKNLALYEANQALLDEIGQQTPVSRFLRAEPLTGLGQVKVENILQEYRHKLEDNLRAGNRAAGATANE